MISQKIKLYLLKNSDIFWAKGGDSMPKHTPKICFAASSGGHLEQLLLMMPLMKKYDSFIVTEKTAYQMNTNDIPVYYLRQVNRKEWKFPALLIADSFRALYIILKEHPDIIISTGVLATIPLCLFGKLFGKKLIYIESFAKLHSGTMSGKLLYKFADKFFVQWDSMKEIYPEAICVGGIY